jgi:hypothetical protein
MNKQELRDAYFEKILKEDLTKNNLRESLVQRISREVCPCDSCEHVEKCAYEDMACTAFVSFVLRGKFSPDTPKAPSYKVFDRVFSKVDFNERDAKQMEAT